MLRYLTAGESHGQGLVAILEGMPAGVSVDLSYINAQLKRRQMGFGRGKRMQIENDKARILSGLKGGVTLGSPLTVLVENKDFSIERLSKVLAARPGHADLAGALKYGFSDIRNVLERASARSTAATVAVGGLCRIFLKVFHIEITSTVISIGGERSHHGRITRIKQAMEAKDTVGGIFEVRAQGVPVGLGSYAQPDRRLDGRLAQALMSIPGIKAVEIGLGFGYADQFGSRVHDAIYCSPGKGFYHRTNNAGGIEGGISNGEDVVLRACMKPIATLLQPLDSVNIATRKPAQAAVERSDYCAVESAGVVAEAACALVLADLFLEKFGSDNLEDIQAAFAHYRKRLKNKR
jgi:chorismate synthase